MPRAQVQDYGVSSSYCGYCKRDFTFVAHGMTAKDLDVEYYNQLLDRGWRRSGTYLYKPCHDLTCCQLLTIRLNTITFKPNKGQRKLLNKWNILSPNKLTQKPGQSRGEEPPATPTQKRVKLTEASGRSGPAQSQPPDETSLILRCIRDGALVALRELGVDIDGLMPAPKPTLRRPTPKQKQALGGAVVYCSAYPLALAAWLRRFHSLDQSPEDLSRAIQAQLRVLKGISCSISHGYLNFSGPAQNSGGSPIFPSTDRVQPAVALSLNGHEHAGASTLAPLSAKGVDSAIGQLELRLVSSKDPDIVSQEFELYKRYQLQHHRDDPNRVTPAAFKRFLCSSPLTPLPSPEGAQNTILEQGFGSFHHQYWLSGQLVAVSVIDLLPRCMSSKYFFWDPDLPHLSLGKLSALLEIEFVKQAAHCCPAFQYYYLGYYVNTCHRMRCKGEYQPSDLLCPKNLCWIPFRRVQRTLDEPGVPDLASVPGALDGLDESYLVRDGEPTSPPSKPSREELLRDLEVEPRSFRRAACKLGEFVALLQKRPENVQQFVDGIVAWAERTGPVWRHLVYVV